MSKPLSRAPLSVGCVMIIAAATLSACATNSGASYQPIIDGPLNETYYSDLGDCQSLAERREYVNGDTQNDAAIGAGVGALFGAIEADRGDSVEGAIAGALIGGLIGGAGSAYEARDERKHIVLNCMAGRGYKVLG